MVISIKDIANKVHYFRLQHLERFYFDVISLRTILQFHHGSIEVQGDITSELLTQMRYIEKCSIVKIGE